MDIYEQFWGEKIAHKKLAKHYACVEKSVKLNQAKRSFFSVIWIESKNLRGFCCCINMIWKTKAPFESLKRRDYDYLISFSWNP